MERSTIEHCGSVSETGWPFKLGRTRCPDPYICVDTGHPDDLKGVICAHASTPAPACTSDGSICQGKTLLSCLEGYRVGHTLCLGCKVEGTITCDGAPWAPCDNDADCVPGLQCKPTPGAFPRRCLRACSCPEGTKPCGDCVKYSTKHTQCDLGRCV